MSGSVNSNSVQEANKPLLGDVLHHPHSNIFEVSRRLRQPVSHIGASMSEQLQLGMLIFHPEDATFSLSAKGHSVVSSIDS